MINTFNSRHSWADTSGNNDFIEAAIIKFICTDFSIELQIYACYLNLLAVIAQSFIKLFFARDLFGDIKLTTNFTGTIKQGYLMASRGSGGCSGKASRPSTNHGNFLGLIGGNNM